MSIAVATFRLRPQHDTLPSNTYLRTAFCTLQVPRSYKVVDMFIDLEFDVYTYV